MKSTVPVLLFTNPAGQVLEDAAGFLRINWGPLPRDFQHTQQLFAQLARGLQRCGWSRILVNQAAMPPFTAAEQQWIAGEWLPRAVRENGYRYGAVLVSPNVFVRLATAYLTTTVQGLPLTYRSFDSEAEALRWLLQQPATPADR